MNRNDLEERLIDFSVLILEIVDLLPSTRACSYLGSQLERSGTSPALNYGEAQFAESKKDFIHKIKICLKELKETRICPDNRFKKKLFEEYRKIRPCHERK